MEVIPVSIVCLMPQKRKNKEKMNYVEFELSAQENGLDPPDLV